MLREDAYYDGAGLIQVEPGPWTGWDMSEGRVYSQARANACEGTPEGKGRKHNAGYRLHVGKRPTMACQPIPDLVTWWPRKACQALYVCHPGWLHRLITCQVIHHWPPDEEPLMHRSKTADVRT
eukprot:scaffold182080_cov23-Tisochrysis_lutea.AAC.2